MADADALRTYEEHAAKGDARGAYNLSVCLARGVGTAPDRTRALRYLRAAADGGLPEAMAQLAYLYWTGRGGIERRDEAEAAKWWRAAAAAGDADAAAQLRRRGLDASAPPPPSSTDAAPDAADSWFRCLAAPVASVCRRLREAAAAVRKADAPLLDGADEPDAVL